MMIPRIYAFESCAPTTCHKAPHLPPAPRAAHPARPALSFTRLETSDDAERSEGPKVRRLVRSCETQWIFMWKVNTNGSVFWLGSGAKSVEL